MVVQLSVKMTAQLAEGGTYTVKATTTNMSFKAGVPVGATLTVKITAVVNSQTILEDLMVYNFAAGETKTFEFPMTIPAGTDGMLGAVVAEALDPDGNKLADGSLDIEIQAVTAEWAFTNMRCHTESSGIGAWRMAVTQATITNIGNSTVTKTVSQYHREYYMGWGAWSLRKQLEITLAPGQSYNWISPAPGDNNAYFLISSGVSTEIYLVDSDGYESAHCYVVG